MHVHKQEACFCMCVGACAHIHALVCTTRTHIGTRTNMNHSYLCDTTYTRRCRCMRWCYVWDDSFNVSRDSYICVKWLTHMCDTIHSYVRHDSLMCVTWLIICVTRLTHICDMTHSYVWTDSYVWHDSLIRVTWLIICVIWLTNMCDMTHPWVWLDSLIRATWLILCVSRAGEKTQVHEVVLRHGDLMTMEGDSWVEK